MSMGKVYLVGAGPSDVGLLTVRAQQLLQQADVVVYDRLAGESILLLIPEGTETIDVGKRAGHHTMQQEQINQVLLEQAQKGKTVVRLKGGDPFLFGRGGEELELLVQHGIPFEVVPGVTSAISVPAYNGIPVTHRDCTSSLHIITGHARKGKPLTIDFESLVRLHGTLVFLMGVSHLADICRGLLNAGMEPATPAAVLQQGTTAEQRRVTATVATLEREAKRQQIGTPAIIVVGEVCSYAEQFAWSEQRPLFGARIVVTRPRTRSSDLSQKLRTLGAEVWEIPTIQTQPISPNAELDGALDRLHTYDTLVFTSPAGVETFFRALQARGMDIRRFGNGTIASIGSGTTRELKKYGVIADLQPEIYDAQHLGQLLGERRPDGSRILIPRARKGSPALLEEIRKRKNVEITDLPIYDTQYRAPKNIDLVAALRQEKIRMVVFTSASTVRGFAAALPGQDLHAVTAICIGKQTQAAAQKLGMQTEVAEAATLDALVEAAVQYWKKNRSQEGRTWN
ncbi:MAG: uroporphyrinogen-III C-methyltransferase [Eubacteriales bacterium]|nr:uroporphyrinogen-III C-methyltransferase [Eubacteriales bacterium]